MYSQGPRAVFPQIKYKIELARDESVGATDESNEGIGANLCMLNLMRRPTPPPLMQHHFIALMQHHFIQGSLEFKLPTRRKAEMGRVCQRRREEKKKETNLPNAFPYTFLQHTETTRHNNNQNKHNAPQYMSQWLSLFRSGYMAPLQGSAPCSQETNVSHPDPE